MKNQIFIILICFFSLLLSCSRFEKPTSKPVVKTEVPKPKPKVIEKVKDQESCDHLTDNLVQLQNRIKDKDINDVIEVSSAHYDLITQLNNNDALRFACSTLMEELAEKKPAQKTVFQEVNLMIKKFNIYDFVSTISYFPLYKGDETQKQLKNIILDPQVDGNNYFTFSRFKRTDQDISLDLLVKQDYTKIYGIILKSIYIENHKQKKVPLFDIKNQQHVSQKYGFIKQNQWYMITLNFKMPEDFEQEELVLTFDLNNTSIAIKLEP